MTCLKYKGRRYEWVYIPYTFNNEIISHHLAGKPGDTKPYFQCLDDLKQKIGEQTPVILHTDHGSVYSSRAFAKVHGIYTILHSMSRVATPTDNPIIESINSWIKQEMYLDFKIHQCDNLHASLDDFTTTTTSLDLPLL